MSILFLSTINLACNPRFYKEIILARKAGYEVTVICFEFKNWSYEMNRELLKSIGDCEVHLIQGNRRPFIPWATSIFKEKLYRVLGKIFPLHGKYLSQAVTRRSDLLLNAINKLEGPFDLVIGHNPGALFPAWHGGKKFQCKTGFDVEDYHPGEGSNKHVQKLTGKLMNTYLPIMDYVSFAAPLMKKRHEQDIGIQGKNWQVFLNLFPKAQFGFKEGKEEKPLKLVWFSQNVNYKRGLEQLIPALQELDGQVHLTLIGNKKEPFFSEFVNGNASITYLEPMEQEKLNSFICDFDVGLAIEPGKDYNNIIALSNKLITYFQAGLYILASDTPAHKEFLEENNMHGRAVPLQKEEVPDQLKKLIERKQEIINGKRSRFEFAAQKSWENESQKLLDLWKGDSSKTLTIPYITFFTNNCV